MMERFRAFWTKVFSPVARLFLRLGISPDAVTIVGTLGVCAGRWCSSRAASCWSACW